MACYILSETGVETDSEKVEAVNSKQDAHNSNLNLKVISWPIQLWNFITNFADIARHLHHLT